MSKCWRYALLVLMFSATTSFADEADELRKLRDTTINLVNALVEQGVLSREKADALIAQAQRSATNPPPAGTAANGAPPAAGPAAAAPGAAPAPIAPGVVRVPYVPESVKREITAEVKRDVVAQAKEQRWGEPGAFPDWIHNITLSGDIRVRGQADRFPRDNVPNASVAELQFFGVNIANSTEPNNRMRLRARFGLEAAVGDSVTVGMRLATGGVGSGSNPSSENQTLGNYETRSTVGFDRAYLAYHPTSWVTMMAGRVGNPYFAPTTLVWADDLSLEGVVVSFRPQITRNLGLFATAGLLPILQIDPTPTTSSVSKWLYGYQTGLQFKFSDAAMLKFAAAFYDYRRAEGIPNPDPNSTIYSLTAAPFRQTGNTVFDINGLANTQNGTTNYLYGLASKFREANVSASLDLGFVGPTHVIIDGDYVKNIGFNEREIFERTGYEVVPQVKGWQTRVTVGYPALKQKHAWQAFMGYRYVQRDAVVDAFTDSDFHLGGTDAKGYFIGGRFAFETNTTVGLRWFSAKQINGVALAGADAVLSGLPLAIDVAQLDFASSF